MAALLLFCDGSVGTDWTPAGAGVCAAAGSAVVDGGRLSSGGVLGVIPLPEGGGTGTKRSFPELEVIGAAVVAGGVAAGRVAAGGGLVGSCTVVPEEVTTNAGSGAADTGGAATG